jgi:carboxymethylenebutenolidase
VTPELTPAQQRMLEAYLRHVSAEFETKRVPDAMASMVATPHVIMMPVLDGGYGREQVAEFYSKRFVFSMPPDMHLELLTRIVAGDHVVEECVMSFTHTQEIPWILPGVAPTGRRAEFPVCVVVKLEDDRVAHEHIYWDQASVLRQLGLLEPAGLPVVGAEAARTLRDPSLLQSRVAERTRGAAPAPPKPKGGTQ